MQDGFEALFRAQYATVRRFVIRRLEGANADDVVASTFELAYRKLPDDHPHPVGWLFRTAANLVKAELRRQERERRAVRDAEIVNVPEGEDPDLGILRELLERLPDRHREVLALVYWDGLSAADAGVVLGCSEQAAWKRISRAKAALRAAWPADPPSSWREAESYA